MVSLREQVTQDISALSEAAVQRVAEFVNFIKFQERFSNNLRPGETEFADEDRALVEGGIPDYALVLTTGKAAGDAVHDLRLEEMLAQITEDNRHGEVDFGPPVGKEVW